MANQTPAARHVSATSPDRPTRMSLAGVVRGHAKRPRRVLIHGVEKIGKTSFAAGAPDPIFVCPEDGIPDSAGAVAHFPQPADGQWHWRDVRDAVRSLLVETHAYKTFVLDTLDWAEPLLWAHLCDASRVKSIEDIGGGYGKGYVAALDGWRELLADLEALRRLRGMHVVVIAHSWIRPFKDPESEGYDRYELKIHKAAAGLWKEWSDAVLFAKHDDHASKDARTKRVRGISSGARLLYTTHNAAYDAGNRYGLPDTLPLSWDDFETACAVGAPAASDEIIAMITTQLARLKERDPEKAKQGAARLEKHRADAAALAQLHDRLTALLGNDAAGVAASAPTQEEV